MTHRQRDHNRRELLYDDPVDCGTATLGRKKKSSDDTRTIAEVHRTPHSIAAYGIFDGHGGSTAADICARNFVPTLLDDASLPHDPDIAIQNSCNALDAFVQAKSALDRSYYGTTMLFTLIKEQKVYVSNVGNSRAILVTRDGVQTITREHDGSNAEEVSRVHDAGGFFQDGKVNNLIPVTRSIGDSELKSRKHLTFPNRRMPHDIVISVPDVYHRTLTSRDRFLVMASAEVWQFLSNRVVAQIVHDALQRKQSSCVCARKVANAAIHAGARGSLSVMILIFSHGKNKNDKATSSPPRRRGSRNSHMKRHMSELYAEPRGKSSAKLSNAPSFVRAAAAEEENLVATKEVFSQSSPFESPVTSVLKSPSPCNLSTSPGTGDREFHSTTFLSLDVPPMPEKHRGSLENDANAHREWGRDVRSSRGKVLAKHSSQFSGGILMEDDMASNFHSRQQVDFERLRFREMPELTDKRLRGGSRAERARSKTAIVSRISELTASGATGGGDSSHMSFPDAPVAPLDDFAQFNEGGPAKVRYREDGSVVTGRRGFLRDLRKTFAWRR